MRLSKYKHLEILAAAMMVVVHGMTSCDDHEDIDSNIYTGYVLCSDGHVASYEDCKKQGKEPVAVVFYTSKDAADAGEGLAIGLNPTFTGMNDFSC